MLEKYMYAIWDAFDEAICVSNVEGLILYVNTAYETLMHIKKEDIVNKHVSYLVTSGIADMVLAPEVIQTKAPVSRVQNLDFGKRILLQGFPIIEDAEVVLVVTFLKDKTKITELREQLDVLQSFYSDRKSHLRKKPVVLHSPAIKKVYRKLNTLADTDVTVLISGPTGVRAGIENLV